MVGCDFALQNTVVVRIVPRAICLRRAAKDCGTWIFHISSVVRKDNLQLANHSLECYLRIDCSPFRWAAARRLDGSSISSSAVQTAPTHV